MAGQAAPHFPTTRTSVSAGTSSTLGATSIAPEALVRADLLPAELNRRGLAVWLADAGCHHRAQWAPVPLQGIAATKRRQRVTVS
jgi:hypothetical protein